MVPTLWFYSIPATQDVHNIELYVIVHTKYKMKTTYSLCDIQESYQYWPDDDISSSTSNAGQHTIQLMNNQDHELTTVGMRSFKVDHAMVSSI